MKMTLTVSLGDVRPVDDEAKVLGTYVLRETITVADVESLVELLEMVERMSPR